MLYYGEVFLMNNECENKQNNIVQTGHCTPISTVGRNRAVVLTEQVKQRCYTNDSVQLHCGDSFDFYQQWESPTVIISDGAYGVLGFEGDTSDHLGLPEWYQKHIVAWSKFAKNNTTLWFWNSEIGWAAVHPILEANGWRYQNCNVWNKGKAHIAGNVNTSKIRRFPVVSEVCVQYVRDVAIAGDPLKVWLKKEWKRSGLPLYKANEACGVKDAAVRKYLDQGHLWYFPPAEMFQKLQEFANQHGIATGKPYFSIDGKKPLTGIEWQSFRAKFYCPHGFTNIWDRPPVHGGERLKNSSGKALHLNQKPLDLMEMIIAATSDPGDVVWEPFGGLFSAALAAQRISRKAFAGEINPYYFQAGVSRFCNTEQEELNFQ